MGDGVRVPKRALTAVRLQERFEQSTSSTSSMTRAPATVAESAMPPGALVDSVRADKKQCLQKDLSKKALKGRLDKVGAVSTGTKEPLLTRATMLQLL